MSAALEVNQRTPGVCRYCSCTADNACRLPDGDTCSWYDKGRTVCTASSCVRQWEAVKKAIRAAARPVRRSSADIHGLIVAERKARSKRYRDAARARGLIQPKGGKAWKRRE